LRVCVRASVRPSVTLFLQYLWCRLVDFDQTFVSGASWDKDELIRFWGQKVKGQDLTMIIKIANSSQGPGACL